MARQNKNADVEFIRALAELLQENDLTELEVKREYGEADRLNVRVSRAREVIAAPGRLRRQRSRPQLPPPRLPRPPRSLPPRATPPTIPAA